MNIRILLTISYRNDCRRHFGKKIKNLSILGIFCEKYFKNFENFLYIFFNYFEMIATGRGIFNNLLQLEYY